MIAFLLMWFVAVHVQSIPTRKPDVPCGVPAVSPITKRIVGGQVAKPGSWPWTVLFSDSLGFIAGSGVIVNNYTILTSAQHFEGPHFTLFDLDLRGWRVYAGKYNISIVDPHETFYRISRVIIHPGYNASTLQNDIALVIVDQRMDFNTFARPACLPDSSHHYSVGEVCYLPGYGSTSSTGNEQVLNQLAMPILDDSVCQNHWSDFIASNEICAGYENGGKDFCGDDIGSPLMCKDQGGAWYIQGLAITGGDCRKANEPGLFEDVNQYTDWIKQTMFDAKHPYPY